MKIVNDELLLRSLINKYEILDYFEHNILDQLVLFKYDAGEYLYRDGDHIGYLQFFVDGKAKVFSRLSNGKSLLLTFYKPMEILGDIELFNDAHVTVNVKTITESYCVGIHLDYVKEHLLNDNTFLRYICSGLGSKLNRSSNNSAINLLYPLENRLASYIVGISTNELKNKKLLTLYDSLTEISELLGTSYRHLHRTINHFVTIGILRKDDRKYVINDLEPLKDLAHDLYS